MGKRKAKFNSLSTPGQRQDLSNYLVELAFLRTNHGIKLPQHFWRQTRYKFRYTREIRGCRKFIKNYGEAAVLFVASNNYITTWTDYAKLEVLLQKFDERLTRIRNPKDTTSVTGETYFKGEDLRQIKKPKLNKGLFEKLKEIKNGI